jgi:hypothetical protein
MKRNDDEKHQHGRTGSRGEMTGMSESTTSSGEGFFPMSEGDADDRLHRSNAFDRPTTWSEQTPDEPRGSRDVGSSESVTILIEGGGFSFNDVFPMASRGLAAGFGRAIAKHALELADPRRRSSRRTVGE